MSSSARLFTLKRQLVAMRKVVTPQRDLFARSIDQLDELPGLQLDERDYFRDVYDHLIRISDLIDSYRDLMSGATDLYLSTISDRQNDVTKQLTIIATIFLPLSFITGFFGQNFTYMISHLIDTAWVFWVVGVGDHAGHGRRADGLLPPQGLGRARRGGRADPPTPLSVGRRSVGPEAPQVALGIEGAVERARTPGTAVGRQSRRRPPTAWR